jgi:hypothetical protein
MSSATEPSDAPLIDARLIERFALLRNKPPVQNGLVAKQAELVAKLAAVPGAQRFALVPARARKVLVDPSMSVVVVPGRCGVCLLLPDKSAALGADIGTVACRHSSWQRWSDRRGLWPRMGLPSRRSWPGTAQRSERSLLKTSTRYEIRRGSRRCPPSQLPATVCACNAPAVSIDELGSPGGNRTAALSPAQKPGASCCFGRREIYSGSSDRTEPANACDRKVMLLSRCRAGARCPTTRRCGGVKLRSARGSEGRTAGIRGHSSGQ